MAVIAIVQEIVEAAAQAGGEFEPILLGWIVLLPLLGFLINGLAGLVAARASTRGRGSLDDHAAHDPSERENYGAAHGASADVSIERGPPPIVNPERESRWARAAAERVVGPDNVVPFGVTNMGGEDFACYLERMGGCFLRIGAREAGGEPAPAHSPGFIAAEESIFVGAAVLAECAREAAGNL